MIQRPITRSFTRYFSASSLVLQKPAPKAQIFQDDKKKKLKLSVLESIKVWKDSLGSNRLDTLQSSLVDVMLPGSTPQNARIKKDYLKVDIGNNQHINEVRLSVINDNDSKLPVKDVVFIHGFGASLGCFARNFTLINKLNDLKDKRYNYRIHFLDNISFGLSSNPKLKVPIIKIPDLKLNDPNPGNKENLHDKYYKFIDSYEMDVSKIQKYQDKSKPIIQKIENYYTDAIEAWREKSKLDKFILVGHSYGGYLSSTYSVKYSNRIDRLILLSPTGVERHAMAITNPITKIYQSGKIIIKPSLDPSTYEFLSRLPILSKKFQRLWFLKIFQSKIFKIAGPFGSYYYYKFWASKLFRINKVKSAYTVKAGDNYDVFGSQKEVSVLIEYLYNVAKRENQSDLLIRDLLTPSTVAKYPLFDKFEKLLSDEKNISTNRFKVDFLYGKFDYMYSHAGELLSKDINKWNKKESSRFFKVNNAGHNLYLDNPYDTNDLLVKIILED